MFTGVFSLDKVWFHGNALRHFKKDKEKVRAQDSVAPYAPCCTPSAWIFDVTPPPPKTRTKIHNRLLAARRDALLRLDSQQWQRQQLLLNTFLPLCLISHGERRARDTERQDLFDVGCEQDEGRRERPRHRPADRTAIYWYVAMTTVPVDGFYFTKTYTKFFKYDIFHEVQKYISSHCRRWDQTRSTHDPGPEKKRTKPRDRHFGLVNTTTINNPP